jgi:hypothetical protein
MVERGVAGRSMKLPLRNAFRFHAMPQHLGV